MELKRGSCGKQAVGLRGLQPTMIVRSQVFYKKKLYNAKRAMIGTTLVDETPRAKGRMEPTSDKQARNVPCREWLQLSLLVLSPWTGSAISTACWKNRGTDSSFCGDESLVCTGLHRHEQPSIHCFLSRDMAFVAHMTTRKPSTTLVYSSQKARLKLVALFPRRGCNLPGEMYLYIGNNVTPSGSTSWWDTPYYSRCHPL